MEIRIFPNTEFATEAATECLAAWLVDPSSRNLMAAGGNTPLELYGGIARRKLDFPNLNVFVLDEYVGVPLNEPRNCANLLRRSIAEAWQIPPERFFAISSLESEALESVRQHERRIQDSGGLDVVVLGLGKNGHLGFNEPGCAADSVARIVDLENSSIEANRDWFGGDYAPVRGVTVGLRTILSARRVLIMAYGSHKRSPVIAMIEGPVGASCPASFLQQHPMAHVFLDDAAAAGLSKRA